MGRLLIHESLGLGHLLRQALRRSRYNAAPMRTLTRTLGLLLLCSLPALAQESPPLDLSSLPQEGQNPQAFVPSGWKIEDQYQGDLNKDHSLDVVLQLIQDAPAAGQAQSAEHSRALLVLLEAGGKLHRVGASNRVLYCTTCAGTFSTTQPGQVKIDQGVILVDQTRGSRESTRTLLRFRYEPKDQRVLLIGEDVTQADRATGESTFVTTNWLTGQRIREKRKYNEKQKKETTVSSKKDRVPVSKHYLEDVDPSKD